MTSNAYPINASTHIENIASNQSKKIHLNINKTLEETKCASSKTKTGEKNNNISAKTRAGNKGRCNQKQGVI